MNTSMDPKFSAHNSHLNDPGSFADHDPQLKRLKQQKFIYQAALLQKIPTTIAGIYTIGVG